MGAIVWATGWKPYDAAKLDTYGFGTYPNVITNVMMERLAAFNGPTQGKILRPSDGKAPETIAFIQCAGSRDENHLPFCSSICCLASMKQATYIREQYPDAKITIFFIDIRATDRLEDFYRKVKEDQNVQFFKGKVAKIEQDAATNNLILRVEDTTTMSLHEIPADMVVLATGMQPNTAESPVPISMAYDDYGFVDNAWLPGPALSLPVARELPPAYPNRFRMAPRQHSKPSSPLSGGKINGDKTRSIYLYGMRHRRGPRYRGAQQGGHQGLQSPHLPQPS